MAPEPDDELEIDNLFYAFDLIIGKIMKAERAALDQEIRSGNPHDALEAWHKRGDGRSDQDLERKNTAQTMIKNVARFDV